MAKPRRFKSIKVYPRDHPSYNHWGYIPGDAGWVYLVRFGSEIKIGQTQCPISRMETLQYQKKTSLDEVHLITCDDARRAERGLHHKFSDYRLHGEWFRLSHIQMEVLRTVREYKNGKFI